MYIRIDIKEFPLDYDCRCGQKPKYIIRVLDYPVEEEIPYVSWACEECLVSSVESYRDIIATYTAYRDEYEIQMNRFRAIRFAETIKLNKKNADIKRPEIR